MSIIQILLLYIRPTSKHLGIILNKLLHDELGSRYRINSRIQISVLRIQSQLILGNYKKCSRKLNEN